MTTFEEHADAAKQALDYHRKWAVDHIVAMERMHDVAVNEIRNSSFAADEARAEAKKAVAAAEVGRIAASQAAEKITHLEVALAKATARGDAAEDQHAQAIRANRRVATNLNVALDTATRHRESSATLTAQLAESDRGRAEADARADAALHALKGMPRRYGHLPECDCGPCDLVREYQ